jgi:SSS family solute:Na+ symporter
MLLFLTLAYLLINLLIGFWAARRVKNSEDFILAGRNLTLSVAGTSIFATWFGSETVMSSSAEFAEGGFLAVIKDPFGAALCLMLIGIFFARPLYKLHLTTFSDYFKHRFNTTAEVLSALLMSISYISWVAAQLVAMGTILSVLATSTGFALSITSGIWIGAILVMLYTMIGGMWAVSMTDFVQTVVIILGLILISFVLLPKAGGFAAIVEAQPEGFFRFTPEPKGPDMLAYLVAWMTVGLGSIPSQDVFQRTMSAKSEKVAVRSVFLAAFLYVTIAMFPLLIGLCGKALMPELLEGDLEDKQMLLPLVVLKHSPLVLQILFFGAITSAIMSTTSGAILAPAATISENLLKPIYPQITDKQLLFSVRLAVVLVTLFAVYMATAGKSIYELAADSSSMALVSLLAPLTFGVYWKRSSTVAAISSMLTGLFTWLLVPVDAYVDGIIWGLGASVLTLLLMSFLFPDHKKQ